MKRFMEKILVVGGAGLVGDALVRAWEKRGVQVLAADCCPELGPGMIRLDMRDENEVRAVLAQVGPGVVAVPAANPHVDYCELHPEETRRVNVAGTLNLARACREHGARMIFYSSDYVFDGCRGAYGEDDAVCPLNEYGHQKAEAEAGVLAADARNLVIRTASVYGWQIAPKNFALQVMRKLAAGESLQAACDARGSPTYVENLAEVTVELAACGAAGVFHVVGADHLLRHEFALLVARAFGLAEALLHPVSCAQFRGVAPRPRDAVLRTGKAQAVVAIPLLGARAGLERMRAFEKEWRAHAAARLAPI